MNKTKFKKYLKKIKSFEDWIENDEQLSAIENDLLLDYVKKLYEAIIDIDDEPKTHKTKKKHKQEITSDTDIEEKKEKVKEEVKEDVKVEKIIPEPQEVAIEKKDIKEVEEEKPKMEFSNEFLSIFAENNSNELSEKLSKRPIKDLKKAFGINEKIFTIKEIFNGDKNAFEDAIEKFNRFNDFEEAKNYILEELAQTFNWDKPGNIKKIGQFIKTIQRRYL